MDNKIPDREQFLIRKINKDVSLEITIYKEVRKIGVLNLDKHKIWTSVKARSNEGTYYQIEYAPGEFEEEILYHEKLTEKEIKKLVAYYKKNIEFIKIK